MIEDVVAEYPNLEIVATTLRSVHSATVNDWGAVAWSAETGLVQAEHRPRLEVFDRVGGGDSFASGLIYGLLAGESLQTAVDYGAAHGALAMTTPGDTSMVAKGDVDQAGRRWRGTRGSLGTIKGWKALHDAASAAASIRPASARSVHSSSGTRRWYRSMLSRTCSALLIPRATLDTAGCLRGKAMAASGRRDSVALADRAEPPGAREDLRRGRRVFVPGIRGRAGGTEEAGVEDADRDDPGVRVAGGIQRSLQAALFQQGVPAGEHGHVDQPFTEELAKLIGAVGADPDGADHPLRPKLGQSLQASSRRSLLELVGVVRVDDVHVVQAEPTQ